MLFRNLVFLQTRKLFPSYIKFGLSMMPCHLSDQINKFRVLKSKHSKNIGGVPAVIQFLKEVVHGVEIRPHIRSFRPALSHDIDSFRRRRSFADRRSYQWRWFLHLLNDVCNLKIYFSFNFSDNMFFLSRGWQSRQFLNNFRSKLGNKLYPSERLIWFLRWFESNEIRAWEFI